MEYVLSLSKWRCGDTDPDNKDSANSRGTDSTRLQNHCGFMCCLGQFAKQTLLQNSSSKLEEHLNEILFTSDPKSLADSLHSIGLEGIYDPLFVWSNEFDSGIEGDSGTIFHNTTITEKLMIINDNASTTVAHKIHEIKTALEQFRHTLKVVE